MATSAYEASYKKYFGDRFDNITKNSSDEFVRLVAATKFLL